jgi:hypothetical protein
MRSAVSPDDGLAGLVRAEYGVAVTKSTFIGYPTDRLLAAFRDATSAAHAAAAITATGIPTRDVTVLRGEEGARRLDGTGAAHGLIGRTRRAVSFTIMDQLPDLAWYEAAVRDGGAVLMVRVRGEARKAAVLDAVRAAGGHFANYYGRFATEELIRWQGPEPKVGDLLKR